MALSESCWCGSTRPLGLHSSFYGFRLANHEWKVRIPLDGRLQVAKRRKNTRKSTLVAMQQSQRNVGADVFEPLPEYVFPQNMELPPVLPKNKKRPSVRPIQVVLRESRLKRKLGIVPGFWLPPRNGLLVAELIPVAHNLMKQHLVLELGVKKLMEVIPVRACSCCPDIHIGAEGHLIKNCRGSGAGQRKGRHAWITGTANDVLVPVDSYHVLDRLGPPIVHQERYSVPRLPAITELCIQAGVDHPDYPVVRWARYSGRQVGKGRAQVAEKFLRQKNSYGSQQSSDEEEEEEAKFQAGEESCEEEAIVNGLEDERDDQECLIFSEGLVDGESFRARLHDSAVKALGTEFQMPASEMDKEQLIRLATRTLVAFDSVRKGVQTLMKRYPVRACGYCDEVQVGMRGHRVKLCGAFKHQQRDGKHGWQEAALSDIFPPNFVWHVPKGHGPALKSELKAFYGQAPAVVELCVQAGCPVPRKWSPFMRIDTVVPDVQERHFVF